MKHEISNIDDELSEKNNQSDVKNIFPDAGALQISRELYEAARLDGANGWHEFLAVSLPGLKREIAVVLSINLIGALRAFDVIRATTEGGPGFETRVLALYMIDVAFNANRAGYGSALAVLLAIVTLILSGIVLCRYRDQ